MVTVLDLVEPRLTATGHQLAPVLREEVLADPSRLAARLRRPPFTDHLLGVLYDRELRTLAVWITPPRDDGDPVAARGYMGDVLELAEGLAGRHGVELHPWGYRFVHQEVRRVGLESQARLARLAGGLLLLLFLGLFGSLVLTLQVLFLLAASVVLAYAAMACVGLPLTFLSLNLALMVLVIGTADLVHMAGRYASLRARYGPTGAALRTSRQTALPILLTSLTTATCLLVTAATPLEQLREFSLSLALGVMVAWAVAVVYAPLLLRRSGLRAARGLYPALHCAFERSLAGRGRAVLASPWIPRAFAALAAASALLAAGQRVDSNWYRFFGAGTPVARTLEFLPRHGFPTSPVECTLALDLPLHRALEDAAMARDMARIEAAARSLPGVLGVDHLFSQLAMVRAELRAMEFPPELAPEWRPLRRQAMVRAYVAAGVFEAYHSTRPRRLRVVLRTSLESSRDLQRLGRQLEAAVAALPLERLRTDEFLVTGQMHFWSAIVAEIPRTFLRTLVGCVLVIFVFFLGLTGSPRLATMALVPNVLPVLVLFGGGRLAGVPLNENICFLVSLVLGVAVDDTLHLLFHYQRARARGLAVEEALRRALTIAGCPVVVTSLLLVVGFGAALTSEVAPVWQIGALLPPAFTSALAADLLLIPWLLRAASPVPHAGERRGYRLERREQSPRRRSSPWPPPAPARRPPG